MTLFDMMIEQLTDKMIIILLIASILSFFLGETLEGIVILIIILVMKKNGIYMFI